MNVHNCFRKKSDAMLERLSMDKESIVHNDTASNAGVDLHIRLYFTDGVKGDWSTPYKSLVEKSPYFSALSNFREGKELKIEIRDIDHEGFRHILKWHDDLSKQSQISSRLSLVKQFIHAYLVADRLMLYCYQDKAIRKLKTSNLCKKITTSDLTYAADLGISVESTLMRYLLERVGWLWSYTHMGNFDSVNPDCLILQGGELAWELLNSFWLAHRYYSHYQQFKMYEDLKPSSPGTGITRLIAMQKQDGPLDLQLARLKIGYTVRQLANSRRYHRLDMSFKPFILRGGLLAWEFVRNWVASCRCHLRKVTKAARSPYVDPIFWHICQHHILTGGKCCAVKWRQRCECLESQTTRIELGIPKITSYGTAKWVDET